MTIRSYQYQIQALVTPSSGSSITRNVEHATVVSQAVEGAVNAEYTNAESVLDIEQFVSNEIELGGISFVEAELNLQQDVKVFGYEYPVSELDLTQETDVVFPLSLNAKNDLFIAQSVVGRRAVRNETLEDELSLGQVASRVREFSVTSALNLEQYGDFTFVWSELDLTHTAEWGYGYDVESELDLDSLVDKDQLINRSLEHGSVVEQAAAWYVENRCNRYKFKSFHGEGGVVPRTRNVNYTNTFLLYSQKDGEILELRNPEMDNRRRYSYNRVNRSFFDGTLDVFTDENSVTEQRQLYTIVAIKREKLLALHDFMVNNLGLEVWLKDWKGVTWNVVILNPGEVYTEDGEGYWTVDFEVVGVPYDGEPVFTSLGVEDEASRAGSIYLRSGTGVLALEGRANRYYDIDQTTDATGLAGAASFTIETP